MFGSEILDIIIGLVFVYLLLSLVCSAINEYIASITNKRGKVLVEGLERMLRDSGVADEFYRHPMVTAALGEKRLADALMAREEYVLKHWLPGFRWIYRMHSWIRTRDKDLRDFRLASYLPARTFALALLEATGYNRPEVRDTRPDPAVPTPQPPQTTAAAGQPPKEETGRWKQLERKAQGLTPEFRRILDTLLRDSAIDVSQFGTLEVAGRLAASELPDSMKARVTDWFARGEYETQKLHDSVEVWFNNTMDRVSGTYKRHTQAMLFVIGMVVAIAVNADTLDLWRRLSTDKQLRDGLARQAVTTVDAIRAAQARAAADSSAADRAAAHKVAANSASAGTTAADTSAAVVRTDSSAASAVQTDSSAASAATNQQESKDTARAGQTRGDLLASALQSRTPDQARAKLVLDSAMRALDQTQLRLGWTLSDAQQLGILRKRTPAERVVVKQHPAEGGKPARADTTEYGEWAVQWPTKWIAATFWPKLIGLLVTAFALSLGAPFWFDVLNKIVNIRNAGRAPQEKAKNPEAGGKRPAEVPTK